MKNIGLVLGIILFTNGSFKPGEKSRDAANSKVADSFVLPVYSELPLGSVLPGGWLLHQLQIMRDGTTGSHCAVNRLFKRS